MKYRLEENHIIIVNDDGEDVEDITEAMTECEHCEKQPGDCKGHQPACDQFKCKYPEE
jgi:hypothetical protein